MTCRVLHGGDATEKLQVLQESDRAAFYHLSSFDDHRLGEEENYNRKEK
jgi:uncharacterized protein YhaN